MNVYLLISRFDEAGGTEEPLTTLAIELKRRGHQVTVFNRRPATRQNQYVRRLVENGVPVVAWPAPVVELAYDWLFQARVVRSLVRVAKPLLVPVALAAAFLRFQSVRDAWQSVVGRWQGMLARFIHQDRRDALLLTAVSGFALWRRPDIVHVFRSELTAVLAWAERKQLTSIYSELEVPGGVIASDTWQRRSPDLNKATIVTAISKAVAEGLRHVAGIKRQIVIIPPVVSGIPELASPTPTNNEHMTVTCIARLSPEKGLNYLLLAAREVIEAHGAVNFLIAGNGQLMGSLKQQAGSLGIADKVRFYGLFPRQDLPKIMAMTDIVVLPSLTEGMPFTIIEAMAYGKPVVASAVGGIPEVVEHQKTGLLVPPKDPKRLAEALLKLVDDEQLRAQMGEAGRRKFMSGGYTVESFVEANLSVYDRARSLSASSRGTVPEK